MWYASCVNDKEAIIPSDTWTALTFKGEDFALGDLINVTMHDGEVFEGNLNDIAPGFIVLANTGHAPIPDYGTSLGLPLSSVREVKRA